MRIGVYRYRESVNNIVVSKSEPGRVEERGNARVVMLRFRPLVGYVE